MKLELNEIFAVIDKVKDANLASFTYEDEDICLKLKYPFGDAVPQSAGVFPAGKNIRPEDAAGKEDRSGGNGSEAGESAEESPMVGVFYASDQEGGEPLTKPGDQVKEGQVLGIVEAMKLMNEIKAEYSGTVEEVLVENGQMVEYGQPLFRIV